MRKSILLLVALSFGCSKHKAEAKPSPLSMTADKVSNHDGKIETDGSKDGAISLKVEGPIAGIVVMTCNADGTPANNQQWDTYTKGQKLPPGTGFDTGDDTWQLGVFDKDTALNGPDGSVSLGSGSHDLTLWLGDSGYFTKDNHFVVIVERPDHEVVKSGVFTF